MTYIIAVRKIPLINYINGIKVRLTIETNPLRFLDTEIIHNNSMIEARVRRKKTKLPIPWIFNIP